VRFEGGGRGGVFGWEGVAVGEEVGRLPLGGEDGGEGGEGVGELRVKCCFSFRALRFAFIRFGFAGFGDGRVSSGDVKGKGTGVFFWGMVGFSCGCRHLGEAEKGEDSRS
jgi:hypothetical protein